MTKPIKTLSRAIAFMVVFCFVFISVQNVIVPKRDWPVSESRMTRTFRGLSHEDKNTLDYLCIGSSFVFSGVSPMDIYRDSGLRGHNIALPGELSAVGYYLVRWAMKRQQPKVVLADIGSLFRSMRANRNSASWQGTIDSLPHTAIEDKLRLAAELAKVKNEHFGKDYVKRSLLPLLHYHDNYKLGRYDYLDIHDDQVYERKGYVPKSGIQSSKAAALNQGNGEDEVEDEDAAEGDELLEAVSFNTAYYKKLLELCEENGCELVFFKVPVNAGDSYSSNWNQQKHDISAALAEELGVKFLDLNYVDFGLDWNQDTFDGGMHLNLKGARKVSEYLAGWLTENCEFGDRGDGQAAAKWDYQLDLYDWEMRFYDLQLQHDIVQYFKQAAEDDNTLLVTVSGGVGEYWTDEVQQAFAEAMGTDFDLREHRDAAYAAISSGGTLVSEKSDDEKCRLSRDLSGGQHCVLRSAASDAKDAASIALDGSERSSAGGGIRIVVYNDALKCVVDSAVFDTRAEGCPGAHANWDYTEDFHIQLMEYAYEALKRI